MKSWRKNGLTGDFVKEMTALKEKVNQQELKIIELTNDVTRLNQVAGEQEILIKTKVKENRELKSLVMEQENQISRMDKNIENLKEELLTQKQHSVPTQAKYEKARYDMSEGVENLKRKEIQ